MKKTMLLIIGILFLNFSYTQEIEMKLNLFGYKFVQNEEKLNWKELVKATESNYEANLLIKKAKSHKTISSITAFVSGVLIGIPIGQSLTDRDPNWNLAYMGGGLGLVTIPFSLSAFNKANKGVDTYNLSLKSASLDFKPEFNVIANANGLGVSVNF